MSNIRIEAIQLVDNVLEQSLFIVNSQQNSSNTLHSESEHFAITCDVNGVDLIKSPTIESMSGKSFDDNFSVQDVDVELPINVLNNSISCSNLVHETIDSHDPDTNRTNDRIERKFEKLSSQLDIDFDQSSDGQYQRDFDKAMTQINADDVSNLQRDFSKISWDDSVSATTADMAALTPDNDIQDLPKGDCLPLLYTQTKKLKNKY